jgi:prepilin-type N-terminal cleavage/methylation domain-containing protein
MRIKRRGHTLVEVLVVAFILGIIIMALFLTLTTGEFSSSVSMAKTDLQAKVRRVMDWIVKDVRQTNPIQINTNNPTANHIKFKKVTGIDNDSGNHTLSSNYIEYNYTSVSGSLTRNEVSEDGSMLHSWVFSNITQSPFYTATEVPLATDGILTSKKLIIVITGQSQVRNSLTLNQTLTEEVKIRND